MNKLEFATRLIGLIRAEKNPPLARYSIVMAAACGGPAGSTVREMAGLISDPKGNMGDSVQKVADGGWIRPVDATARPRRWTPTEKALPILARLTLNIAPATR